MTDRERALRLDWDCFEKNHSPVDEEGPSRMWPTVCADCLAAAFAEVRAEERERAARAVESADWPHSYAGSTAAAIIRALSAPRDGGEG